MIYKTSKLVPSKVSMSLKTRGSEKVPYSKSSCSRLNFAYVCGIILSNDKDRRKNSQNVTVLSCCQAHLTLFYKSFAFLKTEG